jgi:hypothetical protein
MLDDRVYIRISKEKKEKFKQWHMSKFIRDVLKLTEANFIKLKHCLNELIDSQKK